MGVAELASESGTVPMSRWGEKGSWRDEESEAHVQILYSKDSLCASKEIPSITGDPLLSKMLLPTVLETTGPTSSHGVANAADLFQFAYPVGHSNILMFLFFTSVWRPLMGYRAVMVKPMVGKTVHSGEAGEKDGLACSIIPCPQGSPASR